MKEKLQERAGLGLLRTLKDFNSGVDFLSNDYLGYSRIPALGINFPQGSGGSRLLSGNHSVFASTETFLAKHFSSPAALLFNSGYTANIGLISVLSERGNTLLYDKFIHASIRDGLRLGTGTAWHFEHNDLDHLEALLKKASGKIFVITESVFSMDGDLPPLRELVDLCEKYGANLVVDEAHAGGIFGKKGEGLVHELGLTDRIYARVITFGKAFGRHGALILGSEELRELIINFSRPFIYSTAMPPSTAEEIRLITEYRAKDEKSVKKLFTLITHASGITDIPLQSPILIKRVAGGNEPVKKLATFCTSSGFNVPAILSPTVPEGEERIRICLHSFNTEQELDKLLHLLNNPQ